MGWVRSETELTTAATDAALGLVCAALAVQLLLTPTHAEFKRILWLAVLALMSVGSVLGAIAHGVDLSDSVRGLLWKPLYLSLALAVAVVAVGAVYDWRGEAAARGLLPYAIAAGLVFFALTQWLGGAFVLFIAYELVAILLALVIYTALALQGALPGAAAVAVGVALSLAAAGVQVSTLSLRLGVRFDHNGLFHLVQMAGVVWMAAGVRASLRL